MGMIAPPFIYPDLLNAGATLRDRGRYLRSGTFQWFGSGSHGFTGILVGYAPGVGLSGSSAIDQVAGSYGVDGGAAQSVYGCGAVAINRYCAGSVQVNGGIAWGVSTPGSANSIVSNNQVTQALDRMHKDGTLATITNNATHGAVGANLTSTVDIVNQSGVGVLLSLSCMMDYVPPGTTNQASLAMDVYIDTVYRFTVGISRVTLANDFRSPGMTASVGFIPYASSLRVHLRRAHDGTSLEVWSAVTHVLGA